MQVFKAFVKTAYKFLPVVLIYYVIFTALALLLAHTNAKTPVTDFQSVELNIGIIDEDNTRASAALWDYLDSIHTLLPLENKQEELLDLLYYREVAYIVILPEGFEEKLLAHERDALFESIQISGVYSSAFIDAQIRTYLKTVQLYLLEGYSLHTALEKTSQTITAASNLVETVHFDAEAENTQTMTELFYFFQFIPYVITSMLLAGLTPILSSFREKDFAKRTSCASTPLLSRNLQLTLGSVVYSVCNWSIFLLTAGIVYGKEVFSEKGLLCIVNSLLLLPIAAAIALIISAFTPSENVTNMISNSICLGMSFVCGIFIPQSLLGDSLLSVAKFLPFYWYIKNTDLISGFGGETFCYSLYFRNCGIQLLFTTALFAIAFAITKYKKH